MTAQNFKRNLFLNSYREGEKTLTLVCFLLMLKRDKKCLTLAVYFLCLETPGLPACYPLKSFSVKSVYTPIQSREGCLQQKEGTSCFFFPLLQMGANNSSITPLNCTLKNWDRFDPQSLKTCLIFLCDSAWPQYPLEDGEQQLDWFCRKPGK